MVKKFQKLEKGLREVKSGLKKKLGVGQSAKERKIVLEEQPQPKDQRKRLEERRKALALAGLLRIQSSRGSAIAKKSDFKE
ncbi:hypothetical protein Tco_0481435 [Tanacetum coccineum]